MHTWGKVENISKMLINLLLSVLLGTWNVCSITFFYLIYITFAILKSIEKLLCMKSLQCIKSLNTSNNTYPSACWKGTEPVKPKTEPRSHRNQTRHGFGFYTHFLQRKLRAYRSDKGVCPSPSSVCPQSLPASRAGGCSESIHVWWSLE